MATIDLGRFADDGLFERVRIGEKSRGVPEARFEDWGALDPLSTDEARSRLIVDERPSTEFPAVLNLADLDGVNGFRLDGIDGASFLADSSGRSVSSAGDINGDGFDDVIVGALFAGPGGESYVVFGKEDGFSASLDLDALNGINGFRIVAAEFDQAGRSVASAGDVNGDGFDDIIIGADDASPNGKESAGESYILFGRANGFSANVSLAALDGVNGFRLTGASGGDSSGVSVASAGDVNGDGFDDIVIGASSANSVGRKDNGATYLVLGKEGGFAESFDLKSLDGANGVLFNGIDPYDNSGKSVSGAGDVNGDGLDDIIIGAINADPGGDQFAGEAYVVFGRSGGLPAIIDLATLDGSDGFRLEGVDQSAQAGYSVSSAGDINGDGFDDIIIGADDADPDGEEDAGESYVIFGRAPDEAVRRIGSAADQTIRGGDFDDTLIGGGGDDTLAGGDGRDRLKGGAGADDFLLASTASEDADRILDFGGNDRISLNGPAFGLPEGALAGRRFVVGTEAGDANDRLIYDDATGKLFFDADGTGAGEQVLISRLQDAPTLTADDFIVI